ncbi:MAG: family 3 glycosyl hydrolase [Terriglobia bacterium]|nr:MAG: family 3 glycosyl hydrolase [Terriglobia bacterium]
MRWTFGIFILAAAASAQQQVYLDPAQPIDRRIADLVSKLSLQEKCSLLCTTAPAIERLHVPVMNGWNQSLHGIVWTKPTTMFPVPIGMAATWNPALIHDVAALIADEGRAVFNLWPTVQGKTEPSNQGQLATVTANGERLRHNGLVYRSPVINISRDPRWGRIDEAFGEDPYLTSRMTVAYVRGTQGDDPKYLKLATTLKHFAVNNQENGRRSLSAQVDERILHEYFLPHFKAGIVEAKSSSIMSTYNALNGVPNAMNKLLVTDILRTAWGFDGFVVPDSGAVRQLMTDHKAVASIEEAAAKSIIAGHDLDNIDFPEAVLKAVAKGLLSEEDVDRAVSRVLKVRFRLGEFDPPSIVPYSKISPSIIDSAEHRQLALRAARESIVLLTNKNNFLPLDKSKVKTIAVIGPHAKDPMMGIGYTGQASKFVAPLEGIQKKVGSSVEVLYAKGSDIQEMPNKDAAFAEAATIAKRADVALVYVGLNGQIEREGLDRTYIGLPPIQEELVQKIYEANPKTVVVLLNGGPVAVPWEKEHLPAVLDMFYAGEEGGTAVADVLFGDYNPGGRLPYTVYGSTDQLQPMTEYDITKGMTYMYFRGTPVYPFGHGLSYTKFQYSNLNVSPARIPGSGQVAVRVDVRNSGIRAGDEVVQLYFHDKEARVQRPGKELRGFERISLKPGEKRTVTFSLPAEKLAFYDVKSHAFTTEPGKFEAMVGASSEDIRLKRDFEVTSAGQWPQ